MKESKYINLIHKKLNGRLSATEEQELHAWQTASAENSAIVELTEQAWELSSDFEPDFQPDLGAGLKRLKARMAATPQTVVPIRQSRRSWIRIAAAAAIALFTIAWIWQSQTDPAAKMLTHNTSETNQQKLDLQDGSFVHINYSSQLNLPETFGRSERKVALQGEAYFDIAKDARRPFIIELVEGRVVVLGTSFNIRSYPGEEGMEIVVRSGKVRFEYAASSQQIELLPGDRFTFNRTTRRYKKLRDEDLNSLAWSSRALNFRKAALSEVLQQVGRCYNIQLQLTNPAAAKCGYTASFKEAPADEVVASIAASLNMHIKKISDKSIQLTGGGCK